MSIQRIPIFLSAAKLKNFTKAAEEQHVSQTAVSQQIKLLEQELGFELFIREKRSVRLTDAGQLFYSQCRKIMSQYHIAVSESRSIASENVNSLRVGYAGAYELWKCRDYLRRYCELNPQAQLSTIRGKNEELMDMLTKAQIDIALVSGFGTEVDSCLASKRISSVPCKLMISSSHPLAAQKSISPKQLVDIPIILTRVQDTATYMMKTADMYRFLGLSENRHVYVDDFYSLAAMVNLRQGIAIVPEDIKFWGVDGLAFRPISGFKAIAHILAVYPRHTSSTAIKSLLKILD